MELQESGFIHYHVLLEIPEELKVDLHGKASQRELASDCWLWGYSTVIECDDIHYVLKYSTKSGSCEEREAQLMASGLPDKGVRWTFASRGFWSCFRPVNGELGAASLEGSSGHLERLEGMHAFRVESCGKFTNVSVLEVDYVGIRAAMLSGRDSSRCFKFLETIKLPWALCDVMEVLSRITGYACDETCDIDLSESEWTDFLAEMLGSHEEEYDSNEERVYIRDALRLSWREGYEE